MRLPSTRKHSGGPPWGSAGQMLRSVAASRDGRSHSWSQSLLSRLALTAFCLVAVSEPQPSRADDANTKEPDIVAQPGVNLTWLRCPVGADWNGTACHFGPGNTLNVKEKFEMKWRGAMTACPSGYRLPTEDEFRGLLGPCKLTSYEDGSGSFTRCMACSSNKTCKAMFKADIEFQKGSYWSSTQPSATSAMTADFEDCVTVVRGKKEVETCNGKIREEETRLTNLVRCVRSLSADSDQASRSHQSGNDCGNRIATARHEAGKGKWEAAQEILEGLDETCGIERAEQARRELAIFHGEVLALLAKRPQDDANNPAPAVVERLAPREGAPRVYPKKWVTDWIAGCSHGDTDNTSAMCNCMIERARRQWDFDTFKVVAANLRKGRYVPQIWFDNEEACADGRSSPTDSGNPAENSLKTEEARPATSSLNDELVAQSDPNDASHPSPAVVERLAPKFGAPRAYPKKWASDWVGRCSTGDTEHNSAVCQCMIDEARQQWDFATFKLVVQNVKNGHYVPAVWWGNEKRCAENAKGEAEFQAARREAHLCRSPLKGLSIEDKSGLAKKYLSFFEGWTTPITKKCAIPDTLLGEPDRAIYARMKRAPSWVRDDTWFGVGATAVHWGGNLNNGRFIEDLVLYLFVDGKVVQYHLEHHDTHPDTWPTVRELLPRLSGQRPTVKEDEADERFVNLSYRFLDSVITARVLVVVPRNTLDKQSRPTVKLEKLTDPTNAPIQVISITASPTAI